MATLIIEASHNMLGDPAWADLYQRPFTESVRAEAFTSEIRDFDGTSVMYEGSFFYGLFDLPIGGNFVSLRAFDNFGLPVLWLSGVYVDLHTVAAMSTQQVVQYMLREADVVTGSTQNDTLVGWEGNDTVRGSGGHDVLFGSAGNDAIYGGAGNDSLAGGRDNDVLSGDNGDDLIFGNLGADTISGGDGADTLAGGQENDSLAGGIGNDALYGDRGNDTLSGGAGNDRFGFGANTGVDVIADFTHGVDVVALLANANGNGITSAAAAYGLLVDGAAGALLDLGSGNSVLFAGMGKGQLGVEDFVVV